MLPFADESVAAWMRVLDTIETSVTAALAQVAEPPVPTSMPRSSTAQPLRALDEPFHQAQRGLERITAKSEAIDHELQAQAEAIEKLLDALRSYVALPAASVAPGPIKLSSEVVAEPR